MSDIKISELTELSSVTETDVFPVVSDGATKKVSYETIKNKVQEDLGKATVPTATVSKTGTVTTFTVTDKDGTQTVQINDGAKGDKGDTGEQGLQGPQGANGTSATHSWNGTTLTITSASGTSSANLQGPKGDDGEIIVEKPIFVNSIDEMTDTSKLYVLTSDGMIYHNIETNIPGGEPLFTNILETASVSYDQRYNSSNVLAAATGYIAIDYIQVKKGDIIRFKSPNGELGEDADGIHSGAKLLAGNNTRIVLYNDSNNRVGNGSHVRPLPYYKVTTNSDGVSEIIIGYANTTNNDYSTNALISNADSITKARLSLSPSTSSINDANDIKGTIITINEEIVYSQPSTGLAWVSTGRAYTPADYEERIIALENDIDELKFEGEDKTYSETLDYNYLSNMPEQGRYNTNGEFEATASFRTTPLIPVSAGDVLDVKLATFDGVSAIAYYNQYGNFLSYISGVNVTAENKYPLTSEQIIPDGVYFIKLSVFVSAGYTDQYVTIKRNIINNLENGLNVAIGSPLNILILGDSYSEMKNWVRSMQDAVNIKSIVNLAKTSATIRDQDTDRITYPYSDRPNNSGRNTNTVACQIQKLKRLMIGTDLDNGENQIYTEESQYPDVIIIEGGMNDSPDSDTVVSTYQNQFLVQKNAYYKQNANASVIQTNVWVKPSLEEINRTCFAGAYRYACEELITLFPKAQIFLTTASHMNYFTINPNDVYGKIAEQQRMCANILSCSVIDWHAEGNLNTIMIGLKGSGTENDPYTPAGGDEYTTDLLHPNEEGGRRYGRLAGKVIQQKFLGFN